MLTLLLFNTGAVFHLARKVMVTENIKETKYHSYIVLHVYGFKLFFF